MSKLCDHLEESRYVLGKDVFLDGFTYFNAQERRVLAILLRQARSVTVTLLGEENSREEIFAATSDAGAAPPPGRTGTNTCKDH